MTLKEDLQKLLEKYQADVEEIKKDIERTKEEISVCEQLLQRVEKNLFEAGETKLSAEEGEDLKYEIMALNDILILHETKLRQNVKDIHLTKAKIEVLD